MNPRLSILATAALASASGAQAFIRLNAYGFEYKIPPLELEYDQNQNHAAGSAPTIEDGGLTLHSVGNRWSAYQLPSPQEVHDDTLLEFSFTLDEETVDGFQAVCLDADLEMTGDDGQCFSLATTQGWIDGMVNAAQLTAVGQTTSQSIPVGHFFTGPVNYLVFIQDSDGDADDKSKGDSKISGLRLVRQERNQLNVRIGSEEVQLLNHQESYKLKGQQQDTADWLLSISEDGNSVQVNGNNWKALPLNAPYNVTHFTTVEFDIVVDTPADFHAVCLDDNLNNHDPIDTCVSFLTPIDDTRNMLTTELVAGVMTRLAIPYGQMMGLYEGDSRVANYLAFIQDDDRGDKRGGRSTYGNIAIYEQDRTPIVIEVYGEDVAVPNIQKPLTSSSHSSSHKQDTYDHVMGVSADGRTATAHGNSWKRFKLDAPFDVTAATMMRFDFAVPHEAEIHSLCLLTDNVNVQDGRKDCFANAGIDVTTSGSAFEKVKPRVAEGEAAYGIELWVGGYFTGPVTHLGFYQDNDKSYLPTRAEGEASWGNIQIYDLPSIDVVTDFGSSGNTRRRTSLSIANNQVSYDQGQDSTPIREHLAEVSDNGSSITVRGNTWRAFPVEPPVSVEDLGDFVVSFEYVYYEEGEFHAVCFEDNREFGDYDDPKDNKYDPTRCLLVSDFDDEAKKNGNLILGYMPMKGEKHRYVTNLSKLHDRFYELKYLALVLDNDKGDKSGGEMTISNLSITTSLTSCLRDVSYDFTLSDCTVENFLAGVKDQMIQNNCPDGGYSDPLLELMALYDATTEMDVYKKIEHVCTSSYKPHEYDFAKTISSETQVVKEFIDGGTVLNYERDSEGGDLLRDGAGIGAADRRASESLLTWPKHHALDHCDVGAAMCCWVDSRGDADLVDNSDVCYVDMKKSRRTAHVQDGWSVYGEGSDHGPVNCHGFAWGTEKGSIASALKGNALFKVGFADHLYSDLKGNVEQLPGAPMCGCMDRMPVVTSAACTEVVDDESTVNISYDAGTKAFSGEFNIGTIEYNDCGDLAEHYKKVVGYDSHLAGYIDSRVVGEGGCGGAINSFLEKKGLYLRLPAGAIDPDEPKACVAAEDCKQRALALGLQAGGGGHSFEGNYSPKGCYYYDGGEYEGMAFFGTGGTVAEMMAPYELGSKKRLWCRGGDLSA